MADQVPPLVCPTCLFPSITIGIGEHDGKYWATCVSCCRRREDWEAYLQDRR